MGRWFAQYHVKTFGRLTNFTNLNICIALMSGYDVVVDVFDKINNGGHALLIYGYDDDAQTFEIKNSQARPGFGTMRYANDRQFDINYGSAYYITAVQPVETQWAAMWVGRWETDHDGWRGSLVIRRFIDIRSANSSPGQIAGSAWAPGTGRTAGCWTSSAISSTAAGA